MNTGFSDIVRNFTFEGSFIEAAPYGSGHINDTYAAYFRKANGQIHRYILQRINHKIFKDPVSLMKNIESITAHLRRKIIVCGGNPERETLNIIPTTEGKSLYVSEQGEYWRAYIFIEDAKTYDIVENPTHFYNGGKAFGKFQRLLSDFPADRLTETIPDFHNTRKRFEALLQAIERDPVNRASLVKAEIKFAMDREKDASILIDLLRDRKLPLRVTHNDTKFNNVMIDDTTGEGICVIDLDTVMPGLSLYDFGDSIRTGANTGAEDEKDLTKVNVDLNMFESFTKGFLEATAGSLTSTEREYLPFAAKIMTFECGIRFLTDYLNGDTYFKVHRDGHNLDRTRTQFKLVKDLEDHFDKLAGIVNRH